VIYFVFSNNFNFSAKNQFLKKAKLFSYSAEFQTKFVTNSKNKMNQEAKMAQEAMKNFGEIFFGNENALENLNKILPNLENMVFQTNQMPRNCRFVNRPGQTNAEIAENWRQTVNLSSLPTKPEDLHIKCEEDNLILSGKSETIEGKRCGGFKIFSNHVWTKEIKIPEKVDVKSIEAKMIGNKVEILGKFQATKIQVDIAEEKNEEKNLEAKNEEQISENKDNEKMPIPELE
jgi:HSP20 family molecular chaperone IbpA